MKKKCYIFLLLCSLLFMNGCVSSYWQDQIKITVITKAADTDFWRAVKNGCNAAASEYNVELMFQSPASEEDYETQNKMLEEALVDGTNAVVFSAIDRKESVELVERAEEKGIYVVIIDSGIDSKVPEVIISTDNYGSGKKAAVAMRKDERGRLKIGIVNFAEGTANGQEREKGFMDEIEQDHLSNIVGKISVDSNLESAKNGTRRLLEQHPDLNAIIAFNEFTTLGAGSAVAEEGLEEKVKVIGFDNNSAALAMLEEGAIDGLLVQNQFAIGYLGVKNAYQLIAEEMIKEREIYMDTNLVELDNLFDEGIQKIVFPITYDNETE